MKMEKQIFKNIYESDGYSLKINVVFEEASISFTVFQNDIAWSTTITRLELKIFADNHKMDVSDYMKNLQSFIKNLPENVEIKFKDPTLSINVLFKNDMKVVYFTTNLRKVNFSTTVFNVIDKLYKEKKEHDRILDEKIIKCEQVEKTKNEYEAKLNEFIQRREQEESEMLSKFVVILNEKKQHIQHLNELLNAFRHGRPTVNQPKGMIKIKKLGKSKSNNLNKKENVFSREHEMQTDSGASTDDGMSCSSDEPVNKTSDNHKQKMEPIASTSKEPVDRLPNKSCLKKKLNDQNSFDEIIEDSRENGQDNNNSFSQRIEIDIQDILDVMP